MIGVFIDPKTSDVVDDKIRKILEAVPITKDGYQCLNVQYLVTSDFTRIDYDITFRPKTIICVGIHTDPMSYKGDNICCCAQRYSEDKYQLFQFATLEGDVAIFLIKMPTGGYQPLCPPESFRRNENPPQGGSVL